MIKRFTALILCLIMTVSVLASCRVVKTDEEDKGAVINMYVSQEIYDFDPIYSLKNDATHQITSLLFSGLFKMNEKGKVEKDLAESYTIDESKNSLIIKIRDDAFWSDGTYVSANDVVYTFKRILDPEFTCEEASLLFDVKNARAIKNATTDLYVDDIGVFPVGEREVEITFEKGFNDYEQFIENLTSPVLVPLREDIVSVNEGDWAKKPGTMSSSGPFMIRKVSYSSLNKGITLERNPYYFRKDKDMAIDKIVKPYRIFIDYTKTPEQQYEMFKNGEIFFVGDIALSVRNDVDVKLKDALSTATIYLNQNVYVGEQVRTVFKEEDKKPIESVDEKTNIKTIKNIHSVFYTYYNYMSAEEYAAKHPDVTYEPVPEADKKENDFQLFDKRVVETSEVIDGQKVITTNEYREYRYTVTEGTDANKVTYFSVDVPAGEKIFANKDVRKALSAVLDREAIAKAVVFAKAANGYVPSGVFNSSRKNDFREKGEGLVATGADLSAAQALIKSSGITPSNYEILLTARAEDQVHIEIAKYVKEAWESLGFKVLLDIVYPPVNKDVGSTGEIATDINDDIINENLRNRSFVATIVDVVAPSARAFQMLAPFAKEFAGTGIDMNAQDENGHYLYKIEGHITGYNSSDYNDIIERAFAEKDQEKRAAILHEAEKLLMEDMPIIPIVFNQRATLASKELSKIEYNFYGTPIFTNTKLKNYHDYLPKTEG